MLGEGRAMMASHRSASMIRPGEFQFQFQQDEHTSSRVLPPTRAAQKVGNLLRLAPALNVFARASSSEGCGLR